MKSPAWRRSPTYQAAGRNVSISESAGPCSVTKIVQQARCRLKLFGGYDLLGGQAEDGRIQADDLRDAFARDLVANVLLNLQNFPRSQSESLDNISHAYPPVFLLVPFAAVSGLPED